MILTFQELNNLMNNYSLIFDEIRAINNQRNTQLIYCDGAIKESSFDCHAKESDSAGFAMNVDFATSDQIIKKFDVIDNRFVYMVSMAIDVDNEKWILQMISRDSLVTVGENMNGMNLSEIITNFNDKLYIDALTECYNKRYYQEKLVGVETANGAAMLDIDNFKYINDNYGHKVGDLVLKAVADTIKKSVRSSDAVVRYGGDEFFILFWNIPKDILRPKLDVIRQKVALIKIPNFDDLNITVSIGGIHRVDQTEALLEEADRNLYKAKAKRNTTVTEKVIQEGKL